MSLAAPPALQGRVILVSGATGGLGSAVALACARAGAALILQGRKLAKLHRVHDAVAALGADVALYPLDMEGASPDDYVDMGERITQNFGRLDGLVHAAAHFRALNPLGVSDPADIARALHVNVTAPVWMTQGVLPALGNSADAAVVVCLDDAQRSTRAFWGGYGMSQAARAALVHILSGELPRDGAVRVHGFRPGPMRTGLRGRAWMEDTAADVRAPESYAQALVTLLSARGRAHAGTIWSADA